MEIEEAWHQTERLHAGTGKGDPFAAAMRATRMPMIITDPRRQDNPIVYANNAFLRLTGYDRDEVLNRNCRFLQGPETDPLAVKTIRDAIYDTRDVSVDLLNYRKDGSTFWNALYVSPVVNESGDLQFFFASQLDVSDRKKSEIEIQAARDYYEQMSRQRTSEFHEALRELREANAKLEQSLETQTALVHEVDHRVKNNLQMVSSLILLQSRTIPDESIKRSLREMLSRVEALGTVHRRLYQSDDVTRFDVAEFIRDLMTDLAGVGAREVKLVFDLQTITVEAIHAAPIALLVNEIATNALKHAFPEDRPGTLTASVRNGDGRLTLMIADDGVGHDVDGLSNASFGTSLIRTLSRQLRADVSWANNNPGTRVTIAIPTT